MASRQFAASLFLLFPLALVGAAEPPASWSMDRLGLSTLETAAYPALDLDRLAAEDAYNEAVGRPPRFAIAREAAIGTLTRGQWESVGDTAIWRYRFAAEQAVSMNLALRDVRMPEGARLYLYTPEAASERSMNPRQVLGPYGPEIQKPHGEFWTPILVGREAIVELNVPVGMEGRAGFEIMQVNQGYRGFGAALEGYAQPGGLLGDGKQSCKATGGGSRSGACNMDVACLGDDDPWNDPRRSVGAYTMSGTDTCTGSLVNNTAGDQRMLFMTATHCGVTSGSVASMVVYWNYEWPECRTPGDPEGTQVGPRDPNQSSSGAQFLAATINPFGGGCTNGSECSDVTVVELDGPPEPEWDLFWAGWDRRETPAECGPQGAPGSTDGLCATIHHPGVDEKRITFVEEDFVEDSIAGSNNVHWHAFWHPDPPVVANIPEPQPSSIPPGVTEPGSSGSPLYTSEQRFVGVLSGGPAACGATGNNLSDFYGQLAHAWEGLGTPDTRMRDHLDPLGTNPEFIDGRGMAPFSLTGDPATVAACASAGSVAVNIDVTADAGFTDPVNLVVSGEPTGTTASLSPTTVNPPGTSELTVSNLGSGTVGAYTLEILGTSGDEENILNLPFTLNDEAPDAVALVAPADGAVGQSQQPTLEWTPDDGGPAEYLVQVASDPGFADIVFSDTVSGDSQVQVTPALDSNTFYYWRVGASNACGTGSDSPVFEFKTAPAPGDCDESQTQITVFADDVESGDNGWSTAGGFGPGTWSRSTARPNSGSFAWYAEDVLEESDQRLTSPVIQLPVDEQPLTLRFANWREIEPNGASACYDGGIVEVSANGGAFAQVPDAGIIGGGGYRGPIDGGFNNPLAGQDAWCDDPPRPYEDGPVLVDLSAYAGDEVQVRFRLGTDATIGREGWYVDDIRVTSCAVLEEVIFADGFEPPEPK